MGKKAQKKMRPIKAKLLGTILPVVAVMVLVIAATSYLISKNIILSLIHISEPTRLL